MIALALILPEIWAFIQTNRDINSNRGRQAVTGTDSVVWTVVYKQYTHYKHAAACLSLLST